MPGPSNQPLSREEKISHWVKPIDKLDFIECPICSKFINCTSTGLYHLEHNHIPYCNLSAEEQDIMKTWVCRFGPECLMADRKQIITRHEKDLHGTIENEVKYW